MVGGSNAGETEQGLDERKEKLQETGIASSPGAVEVEKPTPKFPSPRKVDIDVRSKKMQRQLRPVSLQQDFKDADALIKGQGLKTAPSKSSPKR